MGIALGDRELIGWVAGRTDAIHREPLPGDGGGIPSREAIADALGKLRSGLEERRGEPLGEADVTVALMPPLGQFRRVDLPPLSDDEAEALIRRDAARYFPGGAHRRVIAIMPRAGREAPVRAVAAPALLLESILDAARDAGFRLEGITTAWNAWASAVAGPGTHLAIARRGEVQLLELERGLPATLRRAPLGEGGDWVGLLHADELTLIGEAPELELVRSTLAARGEVRLRSPAVGSDPGVLAARGAVGAGVHLVPEGLAEARRVRDRRRGGRLLAGAAALILIAVVLHNLGLRRELSVLRAERAAIAEQVAPLVAMQDSLARLNDEVRAVREVSRRSHDWAAAVSELALLLPRETWLTSLVGTEGVVEFEAAGERAGSAIDALRAARSLSGVRLEGLVERELEEGTTVVERFRLSARVRARDTGGGKR